MCSCLAAAGAAGFWARAVTAIAACCHLRSQEDVKVGLPYRADFFHLIYALASMYMGMLFTNWQLSSNTQDFELGTGWASTWVKIGSKWFCEALYIWTVVAPRLLPNRDFS